MKKYSSFRTFCFANSSVSFATGVNGFTKPVITPKVDDFGEIFRWKKVTLNNKITVLGFGGSSILKIEVTFNLIKKNLPTVSYFQRRSV
jgi:hypothetical protein